MKAIIENQIITDFLRDESHVAFIPAEAVGIDPSIMIGGILEEISSVLVDEENTHFSFINGCLIHKDTKTLVLGTNRCSIPNDRSIEKVGVCAFCGNTENKEVVIPDGVRVLEIGCFSNSAIQRIVLPESVELVRGNAFGVCPELSEVVVLGKSTCFEPSAFARVLNNGKPMPEAFRQFTNPALVIKSKEGAAVEECAAINKLRIERI
ncbi:MAG: leucine-rich repeat protein [Clostridia bacterium]|nr:leucine-rich repeat protein [Clostridia bacterium]